VTTAGWRAAEPSLQWDPHDVHALPDRRGLPGQEGEGPQDLRAAAPLDRAGPSGLEGGPGGRAPRRHGAASGDQAGRPAGSRRLSPTALLDLIFPPRCAGCRRVGLRWCGSCGASLRAAPPTTVDGIPLLAAARLDGPWQRAIHTFKYRGRPQLAETLAGPLAWIGPRPPAGLGLVDDVCTTGATLTAAARAILEAGGRVEAMLVLGVASPQTLPAPAVTFPE